MKSGTVLIAALLIAVLAGCGGSVGIKARDRPNIILIMADDLGYETLGCNGGTSYKTPNLDELAKTGARFTNCYANSLCTPTRVTLMTGRYMYRNYVKFGQLPPGEPTFGHMMQDAGYATAMVGKWLLGEMTPDTKGFDEFLLKVDSDREGYADPIIYSSDQPEPEKLIGQYGPDVFWEYISGFLERNRNEEFFLYYPMFLTHFYFTPTPESPEWESGDRRLTAEKQQNPDDPLNQRFFTDMVAYMDKNIGRIVDKLDELGIRDNTLILFLGDNGTGRAIRSYMGNLEVAGEKGKLTSGGTHVPMIANWPDQVDAGIVSHIPVVPSDFFATIAEVTGAQSRRPTGDGKLDGMSFLSILTGKPGKVREWALVEYVLENRGGFLGWEGRYVTNTRWKLYVSGVSRRGQNYYKAGQFYDLLNDPGETSPIAPEDDSPESSNARKMAQAYLDQHPVPERLLSSGAISPNE